ncbi:hypothetical protein ACIQ7Q_05565 [Streptomyces sp. NPDC096176]|uniref:hypothetical protein n=1 Tax=Streptomyces sp. NPDC096176 TaxID=3366079 RepID=UPI003819BF83
MRRRGTGIVAVALCLGGALTACGGGSGEGDVALGAAGAGSERAPTAAVPPKGEISMAPLDGLPQNGRGDGGTNPGRGPVEGKPGRGSENTGPTAGTGGDSPPAQSPTGGTPGGEGPANTPGTPGPTPSQSAPDAGPDPAPAPGPKPDPEPIGPAVIQLGKPVREALDKRWCERVTVEFRNTGGRAAASGTVTFATHIIGALGIDWATIESRQPLPAPIAPGAARKQAYTVCVDAWRVPLGMRIETQDVSATWA